VAGPVGEQRLQRAEMNRQANTDADAAVTVVEGLILSGSG